MAMAKNINHKKVCIVLIIFFFDIEFGYNRKLKTARLSLTLVIELLDILMSNFDILFLRK